MLNKITRILKDSSDITLEMIQRSASSIERATELVITSLSNGGTLLVFGNGGSAADSQHLVAEIVGRFYRDRFPLPAIALSTDSSILTAVANDYGFDCVFSRQVRALAKPEDVLLGISTSGSSKNVIDAIKAGHAIGCRSIALTGAAPAPLDDMVDCCIKIPSDDTPRIQEGHGIVVHILAQLVEEALSSDTLPCE